MKPKTDSDLDWVVGEIVGYYICYVSDKNIVYYRNLLITNKCLLYYWNLIYVLDSKKCEAKQNLDKNHSQVNIVLD